MLCRLCANVYDKAFPLFDGKENILPDHISKYLDFSVHMKEGLPNSVCLYCTVTLQKWHEFYHQCGKVNERFKTMSLQKGPETAEGTYQKADESRDMDDNDMADIDFDGDSSAINNILEETNIQMDSSEAHANIILGAIQAHTADNERIASADMQVDLELEVAYNEQVVDHKETASEKPTKKNSRRKLPR